MSTFWKVCPGGNPTVLIPLEDIPAGPREAAANECMDPLHIGCEQVGFFDLGSLPDTLPRLEMMGGELCVNATRGFALVLTMESRLPVSFSRRASMRRRDGEVPLPECLKHKLGDLLREWQGRVEVSGADRPVWVQVQELELNGHIRYEAWACLTVEKLPVPELVEPGVWLVRLPGISHLVITGHPRPPENWTSKRCSDLRAVHGLEDEPASGCVWLEDEGGGFSMFPAVWVKSTQSLCLESACGSGTLAAALVLRAERQDIEYSLRQPSGDTLTVCLHQENDYRHAAWIGGPVRLVAKGELFLTDPPA